MANNDQFGDTVLKKETKMPDVLEQPANVETSNDELKGNSWNHLGTTATSTDSVPSCTEPSATSPEDVGSSTGDMQASTELVAASTDITVLSTASVWYVDHNAITPEVSNTLSLEDESGNPRTASGNSIDLPAPCPGAGYAGHQSEYLTPKYMEPGFKGRLKVQKRKEAPEGESDDDDLDDVFDDMELSSPLESSSCSDSSGSFEISSGGCLQ